MVVKYAKKVLGTGRDGQLTQINVKFWKNWPTLPGPGRFSRDFIPKSIILKGYFIPIKFGAAQTRCIFEVWGHCAAPDWACRKNPWSISYLWTKICWKQFWPGQLFWIDDPYSKAREQEDRDTFQDDREAQLYSKAREQEERDKFQNERDTFQNERDTFQDKREAQLDLKARELEERAKFQNKRNTFQDEREAQQNSTEKQQFNRHKKMERYLIGISNTWRVCVCIVVMS